ncbi:agmatinase [Ascoidea rubescens DSM 1968]|uniref:Arginase/deacetylase n=1 Tax=Ascoidea rubescens DSM 1968 TaxID=1344418 RepID=A0A1D2VA09_9ASCO|nr:Arginase/deacetylase [Ascoidea rubescens DSM 1968]ODV58474.1 Arginase/deacetylase [Ascoidea rubescens DSM 1968]
MIVGLWIGLLYGAAASTIPAGLAQSSILLAVPASIPESYLDSLYGGLLNGPDETSYVFNSISNHQISIHQSSIVDNDPNDINKFVRLNKINYPSDDDTSDLASPGPLYSGIVTWGNQPYYNCFNASNLHNNDPKEQIQFDVAIVGAPFDTGVSFRPGARFGPNGIRDGSKRISFDGKIPVRNYNHNHHNNNNDNNDFNHINPYKALKIVDCGDVPMTPFDNRIALNQLYRGQRIVHKYNSFNKTLSSHPRIITLGGDHTVTLMTLKSAYETFGKLSLIHFDSHLDTWDPKYLGGGKSKYSSINHGTFLHYAAEKGYINKNSSLHVGIRAPLINDEHDLENDRICGFQIINAREIDYIGIHGIIHAIKKTIPFHNKTPVYITFDIDVLDPAYAPGTGTSEPGGFTTREILSIIDGLVGINLVGADVVEVSPIYDSAGQITVLAAAQIIDSFLGLMSIAL